MPYDSTKRRPPPYPRRIRRGNPQLEELVHDPYRSSVKLRTPVRCAQCAATYRNGRWTWELIRGARFPAVLCPACRRINDRYPAGELTLSGSFLMEHADEALHLIRRLAKAECAEHPLHRVMAIDRNPSRILVTTTDIHLPRRLGHALEDAWGGELSTHYDEAGHFIRVRWQRTE
jgi:hypothetical protein